MNFVMLQSIVQPSLKLDNFYHAKTTALYTTEHEQIISDLLGTTVNHLRIAERC